MAERIGGDLIEAKSIVPIGGDPHIYEATPSDAALIAKADLVLINGLTFEGWINEIIENSGTKAKICLITEGIIPIVSMKYHGSADPHAWMDGQNGLVYFENIKNALVELLPNHREELEKNYMQYRQELISINDYISEEIKRVPEDQRVLITTHDAFSYYGRRYGLRLEAMMGISTESDSKTDDILRVSDIIKRYRIPAVFIESTINPKLLQQIAYDNGAVIGGELYADSIGELDSEAPTYLDMLKHNTEVIVKALSGEEISKTKIDSDVKHGIGPYLAFAFALLGMLVFLIYRFNN
jgi:ABC-type Zn uptake system ZnuABC Zn-binding protein ZnuA